jgi:uncharacterized protein
MADLHTPVITTLAAALLGLLFALLSIMVVVGRTTAKVDLGTGETPAAAASATAATPLFVAVRSQANFAEYVPLSLLLIGLIEIHTGSTILVKSLAAALVLARLMHPVGMRMKAPNPFRAGGFMLCITILAVASVKLLLIALG